MHNMNRVQKLVQKNMVLSIVVGYWVGCNHFFCWVIATCSLEVVGTSYHIPPLVFKVPSFVASSEFALCLGELSSWSWTWKQRFCAYMASGQVGVSWRSRSASGTLLSSSGLTWFLPGFRDLINRFVSCFILFLDNFFSGFSGFPWWHLPSWWEVRDRGHISATVLRVVPVQ